MIPQSKFVQGLLTTGAVAMLSMRAPAQTPAIPNVVDAHFPVGRWIAEHPSKGGIGSWWEFRADGTLTMSFGAMLDNPIERSGNTFIVPLRVANADHVRTTYTIHDNVLSIGTGTGEPTTYTRVGTAPNAADPLLGSWRPLLRAGAGGNLNMALMQTVMNTRGLLVFTPDSVEHLRVPLGVREGTWNNQANTFHMQDDPVTYAFGRSGAKLLLGQPPTGREIDSYIPDPLASAAAPTPPSATVPKPDPPKGEASRSPPDIVRPQILHSVEPVYTDAARQRKISASVRVQAVVDTDGHVRDPRVVKSAADAYSEPVDHAAALTLDQRAIEAVNKYQFAPGTLHGKSVPMTVNVEVSFQIY